MATVIREKLLKANSSLKDRTFKTIRGDMFSIQLDGDLTVGLSGRHNESGEHYPIALVNMASLNKDPLTDGPGLYMSIIVGCDEVIVDITGDNGKVNVKEMGD